MFQLFESRPFPDRMQGSQKGTFKLEMYTLAGQSADKTTNRGPQIQTLNSVVDHRSVFVQLSIFETVIELCVIVEQVCLA